MSTGSGEPAGGAGGFAGVPAQGGPARDGAGPPRPAAPAPAADPRAPAGRDDRGTPPALSSWTVVRLVAGRELALRLRSKVFLITTAAVLVLLVGVAVAVNLVGGRDAAQSVGVLAAESTVAGSLETVAGSLDVDLKTREVPDETTGLRQVADSDLDALVTAAPNGLRVAVRENLSDDLHAVLTVLARQQVLDNEISVLGGDPARVDETVAAAGVEVTELDPAPAYQDERLVLGFASAVLIY
ncbi:hypothetical protein UG55_11341, partial [Frankia sp. EI5c]